MNTSLLKIPTLKQNENITYLLQIQINNIIAASLTYKENKENTQLITCHEHSIKWFTKSFCT